MIIALGLLEWRRMRDDCVTSSDDTMTSLLNEGNFLQQLLKEKGSKKSIVSLMDELFANNDSKDFYAMG